MATPEYGTFATMPDRRFYTLRRSGWISTDTNAAAVADRRQEEAAATAEKLIAYLRTHPDTYRRHRCVGAYGIHWHCVFNGKTRNPFQFVSLSRQRPSDTGFGAGQIDFMIEPSSNFSRRWCVLGYDQGSRVIKEPFAAAPTIPPRTSRTAGILLVALVGLGRPSPPKPVIASPCAAVTDAVG